MTDESVLAKGVVERIGMDDAILTHNPTGKDRLRSVQALFEHTAAIKIVLEALTHPQYGVIEQISDIDAVGHRVVHGGEKFTQSTIVTKEVKGAIEDCIELAPLHNPPNLKGIVAFRTVYFLPVISSVVAMSLLWTMMYGKQFGLINFRHTSLSCRDLPDLCLVVTKNWQKKQNSRPFSLSALQTQLTPCRDTH